MPRPLPPPRNLAPRALVGLAWCPLLAIAGVAPPISGQTVEEPERLAGIERVDVRAEAVWDEAITMEAGGATADQFVDALRQTFRAAIAEAEEAPVFVEGSPVTVTCHVDTYYEPGLIVYALRVQAERSVDGRPVIEWIRSWVGSFTVQQLHLTFRLGDQCAEGFLDAWRAAND